ncbi:unnamed protein product, partial [Candidula unifasciata]
NVGMMDNYKKRRDTPEKKRKETKEHKPAIKEDEIKPWEDTNKHTPSTSPRKADSLKENRAKEQQHGERGSPRKEDPKKLQETPKRAIPPERKNISRREEKVPVESPRKKNTDNEEKYYGYEETPVKNNKQEPGNPTLTPKVDKGNIKNTDYKDNKQEPGNKDLILTPKVEKRNIKNKDYNDKKQETPIEKKDPYEEWVRGKNKDIEKKQDPYDYRKKEEGKGKTTERRRGRIHTDTGPEIIPNNKISAKIQVTVSRRSRERKCLMYETER